MHPGSEPPTGDRGAKDRKKAEEKISSALRHLSLNSPVQKSHEVSSGQLSRP